ncbi:hypothetical protein [Catenuloplanes japonicus]|uniref:hypothetical protein n=1 Tax=Catenuloplanes japonicus TaxID=33876 RepID=UPI000524E586|nr:hypothetical protein [Catenuloplanes japonicus]
MASLPDTLDLLRQMYVRLEEQRANPDPTTVAQARLLAALAELEAARLSAEAAGKSTVAAENFGTFVRHYASVSRP